MSTVKQAYDDGFERGKASGSWVATEENASHVRALNDECVLDVPGPLSGQLGGGSIPELSAEYGYDLSDECLAESFEQGFFEGYGWQVAHDIAAYLD